jgi:hypothetical protein
MGIVLGVPKDAVAVSIVTAVICVMPILAGHSGSRSNAIGVWSVG